ncbi:similar to Saccharomyces cerevisiae YDR315C IPK1 Inositol 1,3,4,5,6-pentakisphosphate 2- kinase [Maudiozyma barnettii]|uniref:Inositol-pentakisphosphate 2-kinase n=1 Tax=Maudiozyma barnettii TaxID=61262 RepID=A0A8H2VBB6_9SACH|nr:inositol pentakisphosphate 2-kinase [Kazachstania barnettii]CAB4252127.1 similar to Saccharomyces cerevisiae YDR315C IPK1 Inositol 1,3,4,5,6-pentakisphosphate 2- kinase [Kazachstania barnettii]CAD1778671.1 similar to Saccharomyces cerevisiae YDR315C IPK1 Inositol 1,3,4,5,6-pentakisphosphate 2- kinase [Kazachstania barnettii]
MTVRLAGKGNANILIDYEDPVWLYRCCIKYPDSIQKCNEYTYNNIQFINTRMIPLLKDLVCPMTLVNVPAKEIYNIYKDYVDVNCADSDIIACLRIPNLRPSKKYSIRVQSDHLTKIYTTKDNHSVLLEIKPKWLHNPTPYCRNCTDNSRKNRNIKYCYSELLQDINQMRLIIETERKLKIPQQFIEIITKYFIDKENVLQKLHDIQKSLHCDDGFKTPSQDNKDINDIQTLMTLRDVSCFIEWDQTMLSITDLKVNVVDVDLKSIDKMTYWKNTQSILDKYQLKVVH